MSDKVSEKGTGRSGALGEFGRIDRYFKPLAAGFAGALGLTDDAAVFGVPAGRELVVTTDAMVAGIHFLADDPPADIAAKLLRVNLSDLAAMAAEPLGYTLVTSLPASVGEDWLAAFTQGLAADQKRYGIALIGGDSVATPGPSTLSVTAFGLVPAGRALTRGGAKAGDAIFVTGTIGDAALGLRVVQRRLEVADPGDHGLLLDRLRRPEPRLAVAGGLRDLATAAIDVSDGLAADLGHIGEVSRLAAVVEAERIPLSGPARRVLSAHPDLLPLLLTGGDDYELVVAAPPERRAALADLAARTGVPITEIGRLEEGPAGRVTVLGAEGRPLELASRGWEHF